MVSSAKVGISNKYTSIAGWVGAILSPVLNPYIIPESSFHPPLETDQRLESVQNDSLYGQLETHLDQQEQHQRQIQMGSGTMFAVCKKTESSQEKGVLVKNYNQPVGAHALPVNPPVSRPNRSGNSRMKINPNSSIYPSAPKMVPKNQGWEQQQQAGKKVKNAGKPDKPDKGSNSPEYENSCPSQPSSNEQKPEIRHGEHLQGELRPKTITSIIDADPALIRLAEDACTNQRVQENVNHLQDELAKGNDNPGIHKKYLGKNVWEHRARGGGRLYTREIGDKVEILAKSGKGKQNQEKVLKRVKQLYVNKKN